MNALPTHRTWLGRLLLRLRIARARHCKAAIEGQIAQLRELMKRDPDDLRALQFALDHQVNELHRLEQQQ